jgi:RNA polymerase sigma-70 factor, ECF subfamily
LTQSLVLQKCYKVLPHPKLVSRKSTDLRKRKPILIADMTDAEVIKKAQSGDVGCFEAIYARHKRRVFSLCLHMTGDYALAEDFTQEAFLQLYRKIATFRGESAFSTWMHRLVVNIVLMHLRRKGCIEVSLEETLEPQQPENGPKKDIGRRDDVLHGSVDRIALERALAELAPGYRIMFILHDIEGYEHNEIAEMLGCSIGNSKSQLHKSRMKLRTLLPLRSGQQAQALEGDGGKVAVAANQPAAETLLVRRIAKPYCSRAAITLPGGLQLKSFRSSFLSA